MTRPAEKAHPGRWLLLPLLLYAGLLVLSAWPAEILPRGLGAPTRFADRVLGTLGVPAGIPVFGGQRIVSPDLKQGAYCFRVRGLRRAAPPQSLFPPGSCPPPAFRATVAREEVLVYRLITESLRREMGAGGRARHRHLDRLLRSVAQHFRNRARISGRHFPEYALLWRAHDVSYRTAERVVTDIMLLRWRGAANALPRVHLAPDAEVLAAEWDPPPP